MLINYKQKYKARGKWIFVPTEECERKGRRIIRYFSHFKFPSYFYHFQPGGHVSALHAHVGQKLFFKIDIQNYYYSIARMRVTRALRSFAYPGANTLAQWSCVSNPYAGGHRHVLPIGFVQSALLSSLVLMKSPVADAMKRAMAKGVVISIYMDDFIGSHDDAAILQEAYDEIRNTSVAAGLLPNLEKLVPPTEAISAFNCDITFGEIIIQPQRVEKYCMREGRSPASDASFIHYIQRVQAANHTEAPIPILP